VRGQNDDGGIREFLSDGRRGVETFGGMRGRHADVDDREIRPELANERDQLGSSAAHADDVEARALEQARQPLAQQNVVVRDHHPSRARAHTGDYGRR
jgi:hypothetical protein